jgi:protein-tyrosine phosphatase
MGGRQRTLTSRAVVIDLHCHLLPGIDDGSPDMETSIAMARAAAGAGVTAIVATPHVSGTYPNDPAEFARRCALVQESLDAAGVRLDVHPGAEVSLTGFRDLDEDGLRGCALAGGRYILLEAPLTGPVPFIDRVIFDIATRGYRIMLAHPERIAAFHNDIGLLEALVAQGAITSVTATSLTGQFGGQVKRFSRLMLERGLVHNLASDAHDPEHRSPALRPVLDQVVREMPDLAAWIDWLTVDVPRAVIGGEVVAGDGPRLEPRRTMLGRLRRR